MAAWSLSASGSISVLKPSAEPRARPPETTLEAACSSGRSDFCASSLMKRVWVGRAAWTVVFSTVAEPVLPAEAEEEDCRSRW